MAILKFYFYMLLLILTVACSHENVKPKIPSDAIVGEWIPLENVKTYSDGTIIKEIFPQCETFMPSSLIFLDEDYNQGFTKNYYQTQEPIDDQSSCVYEAAGGYWSKVSDESYIATMEQFPESDIENTGVQTLIYGVSFPSEDILHLRNFQQLQELQNQEENLEDFYQVLRLENRWL